MDVMLIVVVILTMLRVMEREFARYEQ